MYLPSIFFILQLILIWCAKCLQAFLPCALTKNSIHYFASFSNCLGAPHDKSMWRVLMKSYFKKKRAFRVFIGVLWGIMNMFITLILLVPTPRIWRCHKYLGYEQVQCQQNSNICIFSISSPDSKVQGANMDPSGANMTQVGPMLAPWTLLCGPCI